MNKTEPARRAYIRLLTVYAIPDSCISLERCDLDLISELIKGGYLSGSPSTNEVGAVIGVCVTGITVEGRLFLERLNTEERESSIRHKMLKYLLPVIAYVAGLLSPVITDWLKSFLLK